MQRLYDFLRRHPTWVDSFWAVVLLGMTVVGGTIDPDYATDVNETAFAVITLALCLSIALRRRMPEKMLVLAAAAGIAQLILDVPRIPADFAMLVVIYTVAAMQKMMFTLPSAIVCFNQTYVSIRHTWV